MVDAVCEPFHSGVYTEVLLHELVLKEETSITEVARNDRWFGNDVADVLDIAYGPYVFSTRIIRHVTSPYLEQGHSFRNLRELLIEWNLTTSIIVFTRLWPHRSDVWVGHEPCVPWHFVRYNRSAIRLVLGEFWRTNLTKCVVVEDGRDLCELPLDGLLIHLMFEERNLALEVIGEEVEAVCGTETHVCQVIYRLHAISCELDSYRRCQARSFIQEAEVGLRHANETHLRATFEESSVVMAAHVFPFN